MYFLTCWRKNEKEEERQGLYNSLHIFDLKNCSPKQFYTIDSSISNPKCNNSRKLFFKTSIWKQGQDAVSSSSSVLILRFPQFYTSTNNHDW